MLQWARRDEGATSAEYMGLIVIVGLILGSLLVTDIGGALGRQIEAAYCLVAGQSCEDAGASEVADGDAGDEAGAAGDEAGDEEDDEGCLDSIGGLFGCAGDVAGDVGGTVVDGVGTVGGAVVDGVGAFGEGLILGDAGTPSDNPILNVLQQAGHITSGVLVVGDIRDAGIAIHSIVTTGEGWGDLGLSVVGLVPIAGDIIKGGRGVVRVADSVDDASDAARAADDAVDAGRGADDAADGGRGADDAADGGRLTDAEADALRERTGRTNSEDAQILEENRRLILGVERPPGHQSHHIVPRGHRRAEDARAILDEYDVPINHERNGIELPNTQDIADDIGSPATPHRNVHTNRYIDTVTERLEEVVARGQAEGLSDAQIRDRLVEELTHIGDELQAGTFPYRADGS